MKVRTIKKLARRDSQNNFCKYRTPKAGDKIMVSWDGRNTLTYTYKKVSLSMPSNGCGIC